MTEQQIQKKKIKELEDCGYYVIKLIKTNKNGIPDILALHPTYGIEFYEVKNKLGNVRCGYKPHLPSLREYELRDPNPAIPRNLLQCQSRSTKAHCRSRRDY